MAEYYYFAASLPMLRTDKDIPISYPEFMEKAADQLSKRDYENLTFAVFDHKDDKATLPIVKEWQDFAYRLDGNCLVVTGFGNDVPELFDMAGCRQKGRLLL